MHLAVPGAVAHLSEIKRTLNQGGVDQAWLSLAFHSNIMDWKAPAIQAASMPTHLIEIIRHELTHLGFCNTYELGAGGVWLDPAGMGQSRVWRDPWPADVTLGLVSQTNPHGAITNSDLYLAALVIQEATLLEEVPKACMAAPRSGSDNTPTFS